MDGSCHLDTQLCGEARLLRNQQDIRNAMKPFYGEDAGNQLGKLLTEHIVIAGKVVDAAKSGNAAELEKNNKEWYRNADDIASFLSKANPNWTEAVDSGFDVCSFANVDGRHY
jgi:hypothetical protein